MGGGCDGGNDAEGRQLDNGQSAVSGPGNRFQVFDARRKPGDHVEFPDLVGDSAHTGFVDSHLREALGVLQRRRPNGLDDSPPGFERQGLQVPLCNGSRVDRLVEVFEDAVVPVSGGPGRRRDGRGRALFRRQGPDDFLNNRPDLCFAELHRFETQKEPVSLR